MIYLILNWSVVVGGQSKELEIWNNADALCRTDCFLIIAVEHQKRQSGKIVYYTSLIGRIVALASLVKV